MTVKNIAKEYDCLRKEVEDCKQKIVAYAATDSKVKALYKGCQILFSPLIHQPKVLLIGLNPGAGFFNENNAEPVDKLEPQPVLEYTLKDEYGDYYHNYALAKETRYIFEKAGKLDYLDEAVKTNFLYFSTTNQTDCWALLWSLQEGLGINLDHLANEWTTRLITMVEPQLIVCEGAEAFMRVNNLLSTNKVEPVWIEDSYAERVINDVQLIGYKRRYSNILNKDGLASFLSQI